MRDAHLLECEQYKQMTVALMPNCGFLSETTRMMSVYQELEKLGTPAVLATHGGTYESVLSQAGISWERIPPIGSSTKGSTEWICRSGHFILSPRLLPVMVPPVP